MSTSNAQNAADAEFEPSAEATDLPRLVGDSDPSADEQESVPSDHEEHDHVAMTYLIDEETARKAEQFRQNLKRILADRDKHVHMNAGLNAPISMMPDRGNLSLIHI